MRTLLIVGTLLIGLSGQVMSMGHPHNLFAARKQMRAKALASTAKPKLKESTHSSWQPSACIDKVAFGKRLLAALTQVNQAQAY